jgi:DNA polymerase
MSKSAELNKVKDAVVELTTSPLYAYRTENKYFPVIGEGSADASIMFVGEAPGKNEAKTGKPFCGRAGKILDELLQSIGIAREDVYITNIVKDRPPQNRDPLPEEIRVYGPFLDRQIEIIKPKIIATLGRYSFQYVMNLFDKGKDLEPISLAHGKAYDVTASYGAVKIVALYHPAAAIYNQKLKGVLFEDFKILSKIS